MKKSTVFIAVLFAMLQLQSASAQTRDKFKPVVTLGASVAVEGYTSLSGKMGALGVGVLQTDYDDRTVEALPGILFEAQFSKHSGLESGLYYRDISKTLSLPVLYKFSSRILNFSVGATFDFAVNDSYVSDPVVYGALLKLSKDIKLYRGLYLDLFVQGNGVYYIDNANLGVWWGGGVGLKYRF